MRRLLRQQRGGSQIPAGCSPPAARDGPARPRCRRSESRRARRRGSRAPGARAGRCPSRWRRRPDAPWPGCTWALPPGGVFGLVVVEALRRRDVGDGQRAVAQDADGQLPAGDVFLHQRVRSPNRQVAATSARRLPPWRMISTPTEEPSFTGLTTYGSGIGSASASSATGITRPARHGQPGGHEHRLRRLLVHRDGGGADAGMRIGNAEPVQHALDRAVLAEAAVQRVEHHVRGRGERGDQRAPRSGPTSTGRTSKPAVAQGRDHLRPLAQADLALGRDAAVQHRDASSCDHLRLGPAGCRCA